MVSTGEAFSRSVLGLVLGGFSIMLLHGSALGCRCFWGFVGQLAFVESNYLKQRSGHVDSFAWPLREVPGPPTAPAPAVGFVFCVG